MALLKTSGLTAFYGDFQALFGIDLVLNQGETIAIIGANGAGKTTLMRSLSGVLRNSPEMVVFDGETVGDQTADGVMARGLAMVPEGRRLFPSLTVEENLLIGSYGGKDRRNVDAGRDLRPLPDPRGTPKKPRHGAFRRSATNGRHWPRTHVEPEGSAV